MAISKTMQNYCGDPKCEDLLHTGLDVLRGYEEEVAPGSMLETPRTYAQPRSGKHPLKCPDHTSRLSPEKIEFAGPMLQPVDYPKWIRIGTGGS
jgi:hypothetical protein